MNQDERQRFALAVADLRAWHAPDDQGARLRMELLTAGEWMGRAVYGLDRFGVLAKCRPLARVMAQMGTSALFALWESEARALRKGSRVRGWIPACMDALPVSGAAIASIGAARLGGWL